MEREQYRIGVGAVQANVRFYVNPDNEELITAHVWYFQNDGRYDFFETDPRQTLRRIEIGTMMQALEQGLILSSGLIERDTNDSMVRLISEEASLEMHMLHSTGVFFDPQRPVNYYPAGIYNMKMVDFKAMFKYTFVQYEEENE
jgi:hypothetical protein